MYTTYHPEVGDRIIVLDEVGRHIIVGDITSVAANVVEFEDMAKVRYQAKKQDLDWTKAYDRWYVAEWQFTEL